MKGISVVLCSLFFLGCSCTPPVPEEDGNGMKNQLYNSLDNLEYDKACPIALKMAPQRDTDVLVILYECFRKYPGEIGYSEKQRNDYALRILKELLDREDSAAYSLLQDVYYFGYFGVRKSKAIGDCWLIDAAMSHDSKKCQEMSSELAGLKYLQFETDDKNQGIGIK